MPIVMVLAPGTRFGVYEITAQIGEGGMGEVYRATDTTLKRAVAIRCFVILVRPVESGLPAFNARRKSWPP